MYARACYSMLLVSANGPALLRLPVLAAAMLPVSRGLAIRLGSALLTSLDWFLPRTLHRQLLLTSALMGMLDVVLDETASSGEAAVLRTASLISREAPASSATRRTTDSKSRWKRYGVTKAPGNRTFGKRRCNRRCATTAWQKRWLSFTLSIRWAWATAGLVSTRRSRVCGTWWVLTWGCGADCREFERPDGIANNNGWLILRFSCR